MKATKSANLQNTLYNLLQFSTTTNHLKQIHSRLLLLDLHRDQFLITHLISLCHRLRAIDHAIAIFAQTHHPTTYLFNAMIQFLAEAPGYESNAFSLYILQFRSTIDPLRRPDRFTFPPLLKSCSAANLWSVGWIQEIHSHVIKLGTSSDVYVGTGLLHCYCKYGQIECARKVFDEMPVRSLASWNSMVSGLAKCGLVGAAREVFEEMPSKNVVSWTSVISGYAQNGYLSETLAMFEEMGLAGVKPNDVTLASVLSACANIGALDLGKKIHSFLECSGYGLDLFVGSALIDMYSKCSVIGDAAQVFERMPEINVVACSAMIMGWAMHGRATEALAVFEDMRMRGMLPNDITFVGVLCACCHVGLVDKGQYYFNCMRHEHFVFPKLEHCACIVDLLGRAGHIGKAFQFIAEMSVEPDIVVWGVLLRACRIHRDFELGEHVAHQMLELDPRHCGALLFIYNKYTRTGDCDGMAKAKQMMEISGMKRIPSKSWIEVNHVVYQFIAGEKSHPLNDGIYAMLEELSMRLELEGYLRNMDSVLLDIEEEEKE